MSRRRAERCAGLRRLALRALLAGLASLAGCGATASSTRAGGDATISVTCPLGDATVWVDERLIGEVRDVRGGILVDPGAHRVEIRREQHFPKYFELDARAGQRHTLACELVAQPE